MTYADTSVSECDFGFCPTTPFREGLRKFVEWYKGLMGRFLLAIARCGGVLIDKKQKWGRIKIDTIKI